MTKQEFLDYYAKNSGFSPEDAERFGLDAKPCDCDYENCQGWTAVFPFPELANFQSVVRLRSKEEGANGT